jgi:two-component system cell cycle sensor histidine kinase/response regulator CckA
VPDPKRVLIVDDDEGSRRSLALVLGKKGYEVETGSTGREALQKAKDGFFDVALLDIRMPDVQGVELLAPLKETHPDIALIVMTGYASAYITKPLDLDAVLSKVEDIFEKQRLIVENRRLYEAVVQELTQRLRVEEEREKVQAQLFQAQKMEAIGRLAGGIAHDFNNLLTVLLGYSEFVLECLGPGDELREDVGQIQQIAQRATALTHQLLAFSRNQPFQPQVIEFNALIAGLEDMLRRLLGEGVKLDVTLGSDSMSIKADPGEIEQVVINLAVNARDAMPGGGTLTIWAGKVIVDQKHCQSVPEARSGTFACLSVADTGMGMDQETAAHIFEPFFTTKERGTGLGLAVVYGIVKQHEGWIEVRSTRGEGSTFAVHLPLFAVDATEAPEDERSLVGLQGQGERILLVEDEGPVRSVATAMLQRHGYVVTAVETAEQALDVFEWANGTFDLVFSDVVLPGLSGFQLADRLLSRRPGLPILLSSGYLGEGVEWPILQERGFHFLQKPYAVWDLLDAIQEVLANG